MTSSGWCFLVLTAVCTAAANVLLRAGILRAGGFKLAWSAWRSQIVSLGLQPMFLIGLFLYGVAAVIWFRVISTEDLGTSYPLVVSVTFVLVTLGAACCFNERVSSQKLFGMAVILAGIVLVARA